MKITDPLTYIKQNQSAIGEFRKEIADSIIAQYNSSDRIDHIHALAIAYRWKGAKYRGLSINSYERYISMVGGLENILDWSLVSDYGLLLQKEHSYEKAIACYKHLIKLDNGENCSDYTRILDCCLKTDFKYAIDIYYSIVYSDLYEKYRWTFDNWLADAFYKNKQYTEALECYLGILKQNENNISIIIKISETYVRLKFYREALNFLIDQKHSRYYHGSEKNVSFTYNLDKQICKINNIYIKHLYK